MSTGNDKYLAIVKNRKLVILDRKVHELYDQHVAKWQPCAKCKIGEWAHNKCLVRGTIPCDILFIGEGPGQTENLTGIPFIGPAGKLLDKWIEESIEKLENKEIKLTCAVSNVVACRPTDYASGKNRPPDFTEEEHCLGRAAELLQFANPRMVFLMGKVAEEWWINNWRDLTKFEGSRYLDRAKFRHPSYVLRMTQDQQDTYNPAVISDMSYSMLWLQERIQEREIPK